jgi:hypothetical protein
MMKGRFLLKSGEVSVLPNENVVFGHGFQRVDREGQVHRMPLLGGKIDVEAPESAVNSNDSSKSPTFVLAVTRLQNEEKGLHVLWFDLTRSC